MSEKSEKDQKQATLNDEDMSSTQDVGRRSAITAIGAATIGAVGVVTTGCIVTGRTGITDSDPQDPAGNGRGGARVVRVGTGITDGDAGSWADGGGNGRGAPRGYYTGVTDGDGTPGWTDPAGQGRGGPRR